MYLSTAIICVIACAPVKNTASTTRSLDNLTATDKKSHTLNSCGATYKTETSLPKEVRAHARHITAIDGSLRLAALNALSHVPPAISEPFFKQGGTIELLPNSVEACRVSPLTAKERAYVKEADLQVDSCWLSSDKTSRPVIVLPADEKKIRHNLLRIMVFFYNEYLVARLDAVSAKKSKHDDVRNAIATFNKQKLTLMEAFLEDAAVFNLNAAKKLWDLRAEGPNRFANIVLAEAVDSYYCSPLTVQKFSTHFPRTWRAFSKGDNGASLAEQLGRQAFKK